MTRPRLCCVCRRPGTVKDQVQRPTVVIARDGRTRRGVEWVTRFLCDDHLDHDPWA